MQKKKSKQCSDSENNDVQVQGNSAASQLQFYPTLWRVVLEAAKTKLHFYLTTVKPFPRCEEGIAKAAGCISEALSEHQDANKKVEPGM